MKLVVDADIARPATHLEEIIGRLSNPRPMLEMLGKDLEGYEADLFATAGHGEWAPDEPVTLALKHSSRTLVDTGKLRTQLTTSRIDGTDTVAVSSGDATYARFLRRRRNPAPMPDAPTSIRWAQKLLTYVVDGRV